MIHGYRFLSIGAAFFVLQSCPLTNLYRKYGAFGSPEDPHSAMEPIIRVLKSINKQLRRDVKNLASGKAPVGLGMLASFLGGSKGVSMTPLRAAWTKEKISITSDTFNLMSRASYYDNLIKGVDELADHSIRNWDGDFTGVTQIMKKNTADCVYDFFTDMHLAEDQMETEIQNLKTQEEVDFLHQRMQKAEKSQSNLETHITEYVKYRTILSFTQPARSAESAAALTVELLTDLAESTGGVGMTAEKIADIWDAPLTEDAALAKRVSTGLAILNPVHKAAHAIAKTFFQNATTGFGSLLTDGNKTIANVNKKMDAFSTAVWGATGKSIPANKGNYEYRFQIALCGVLGIVMSHGNEHELRPKKEAGKTKAALKKEQSAKQPKKPPPKPPRITVSSSTGKPPTTKKKFG